MHEKQFDVVWIVWSVGCLFSFVVMRQLIRARAIITTTTTLPMAFVAEAEANVDELQRERVYAQLLVRYDHHAARTLR
jgi:hypothetical protein